MIDVYAKPAFYIGGGGGSAGLAADELGGPAVVGGSRPYGRVGGPALRVTARILHPINDLLCS